MSWIAVAIGGSAVLGAGTSLLGASQQAGAAKDASNAQLQASQQTNALNKYVYDQNRADQGPYRGEGTNALYQIGDLLGVPRSNGFDTGVAGSNALAPQNQDANSLGQIRDTLAAWDKMYPGNAGPIIQMIDGGASLPAVQSALSSLRSTTTNPANTAFLDHAISVAGSANSTNGYTVQQPAGGNVFDNSAAGIAGRQSNAFDTFRTDPGYQFALDQGSKALQNSAAARGVLNSGATAKKLVDYGQGAADQQYGAYFNRLQSLAGIGQSATNATQQAGQAYATGAGTALGDAGNARASGYINSANATSNGLAGVSNALGQGLNQYQFSNFLNNGSGRANSSGGYFADGSGFPSVYITGRQ